MATFYAAADGSLRGFVASFAGKLATAGGVPADATNVVEFDEFTNLQLVADMQLNIWAYTAPTVASAPQLRKDGIAVSIAAPSPLYALRATILAGISETVLEATVSALWSGTATSQQQQKAIAFLAAKMRMAGLI